MPDADAMQSPRVPAIPAARARSPSPVRASEKASGWGHWKADGLFHADMPEVATHYALTSSRSVISTSPESMLMRTLSTSLLDGSGSDKTNGMPENEASKPWTGRSMPQMADYGTIPEGLPLGLTDNEKKLWLAIYCRARELLSEGDKYSVRQAVEAALDSVTEKHSLEYRFGVRWNHSIKTCLAMRQPYRSSDVYS